jgi:hypothetical protein
MSGGTRKTQDSGKWRPRFSGGPRAYSLLKALEHDNRYKDM